MEIRQLRYFLVVCEHNSIAAAARTLHIAQPALSRQMTMLEEELKVTLFHRLPRGVALTRAGEAMMQKSHAVMSSLEELRVEVRSAQDGESGSLRIGVIPNYGWLPIISALLHAVRTEIPNVRITIEPRLSRRQEDAIRAGELDAGIMAWRPPADPSLAGIPVYVDHLAIAVPKSAKILQSGATRLREFADEDFIMFPRDSSPATFDLIFRLFQSAGINPRVSQTAYDIPTVIGLVESGLGCGIVPSSYGIHKPEDVVFIPIEEKAFKLDLEFVWSTSSTDPVLRHVVRLVEMLASPAPIEQPFPSSRLSDADGSAI